MMECSGTLRNRYSTLDIFEDGTLRLTGFYQRASYR
jgi:hypothetical protein